MITVAIGFGHQEDVWYNAFGVDKFKYMSDNYYIQMPVTVAKNFWVTPEIGRERLINNAGSGHNEVGRTYYLGVKWQIDF